MFDYNQEIVEENKELIDRYVGKTDDGLLTVRYFIGRDYTFGYDYIHVYFRVEFQALVFLMRHKDECMPKS